MKKVATALALSCFMVITLLSCGKKAQDSKSKKPEEIRDQVVPDFIEETHKELYAAILAQDEERAKSILDLKTQIDLNKLLEDGETLLTLAAKYNLTETVKNLVANGASIFRTNIRKENPLMVASMLGFENLVRNIYVLGAKLDSKDANGNTALHLAILGGYESIALFLAEDADINITNDHNQNALMLAELQNLPNLLAYLRVRTLSTVGLPTEANLRELLTVGDVQTLKNLFMKYTTLKILYPNLNFHVIVINSHSHDKALSIMEALKDAGISYHGPENASETPLIAAVKKDYADFAEIMLKAEVNPDVIDDDGKTALIWAIEINDPLIVKLLLDYRASPKYEYFDNGKKKSMKACDVVKAVKKKVSGNSIAKKKNADIKELLGCGFLGLF